MRKSQIVALILVEALSVPMLALSWGQFDTQTARGFVAANLVWQIFVLSGLFQYAKKGKKK